MTEEQHQFIENRIQSGYPMTSSICLVAGFKIFKANFFLFALYALLIPIISLIFSLLGLGLGGLFVWGLVITPVLSAGLYLGAKQVATGQGLEFRDFFNVIPKASPIIIANLLGTLVAILILIPTYFIFEKIGMLEWYQAVALNPESPPEPPMMNSVESTTFFLNMIPLIYLQVGFSWAFQFILFYDANPLSALELSRRLINRRWGAQFMLLLTFVSIFMLASMLVAPLASISLGLANVATMALFFLLPWVYCSLYVGFSQALASDNEIKDE